MVIKNVLNINFLGPNPECRRHGPQKDVPEGCLGSVHPKWCNWHWMHQTAAVECIATRHLFAGPGQNAHLTWTKSIQKCPISSQVAFLGVWPNTLGIAGALLVMACVVGIALEERYLSDGSSDNIEGTEEQGWPKLMFLHSGASPQSWCLFMFSLEVLVTLVIGYCDYFGTIVIRQ